MIAKRKTLARCAWASDDLAIRYHDEEWGVPVLMTARSLNSSFWKERSICKTTAPITPANLESRCQPTSRHSFPSAVAPAIVGVIYTQGAYFGYMSISAAAVTRYAHPDLETIPRNPKNGGSAKGRKSEKRSSTNRHSSCQRSSVSPGHQYSHQQSLELSAITSSPAPSSPQASR